MNNDSDLKGYIAKRYAKMKALEKDYLVESPPFPKNIMLELTNACNHSCVFCANTKMTRAKSLMESDFITSIMKQAKKLGASEIGFYTTGEPFAHPKLAEFVKNAKDLGYSYTYLSTNGALPTKEKIKSVLDAGLDSIKFSINAYDNETYKIVHGRDDWAKVIENLMFVSDYKTNVNPNLILAISYVVIDANRDKKGEFKEKFGKYVDDIDFVDAGHQMGNMLENFDTLVSVPIMGNGNVCHMPFNRLHVSAEGFLTLCCVDYQNYLTLFDLNKTPLEEAWNHSSFIEIRKKHLEDKLEGTLCYNCMKCEHTKIKPLVEEFASTIDFEVASTAQKTKQLERVNSN